jgi:hypothetical protein
VFVYFSSSNHIQTKENEMGEVLVRLEEMITECNILARKNPEGKRILKKQTCEGEKY